MNSIIVKLNNLILALKVLMQHSLVLLIILTAEVKGFSQDLKFDQDLKDCGLLGSNLKLLEQNEDFEKAIKVKFRKDSISNECDLQNLILTSYYAEVLKLENKQSDAVELWNHIINKASDCYTLNEDTCFLRLMIIAAHNIENYGSFIQCSDNIFKTAEIIETSKSNIPCELKTSFFYLPMTVHWENENFRRSLYFINQMLDICSDCTTIFSDDFAYYLYLKAFILGYLNEHEESYTFLLKASEMYEKTETGIKGHSYRNIQFNLYTFFQKQEYFDKALLLTKQVLMEAEKEKNIDKSLEYQIEMIRLYSYTGVYDSAYHYVQKSNTLIRGSKKYINSMYHVNMLNSAIITSLRLNKNDESDALINELTSIYKQRGLFKSKNKLEIDGFKAALYENQNETNKAYHIRKSMLVTIDSLYDNKIYHLSEEYKLSFLLHKMDSFYQAFRINEKWINAFVNRTDQRNKYLTSSELGGVLLKFNSFFNVAFSNLFNIKEKFNIDDFYNKWMFKQGFIYYRHQKINAIKDKNPEIKDIEKELRDLQTSFDKSKLVQSQNKIILEKQIIEKEQELLEKLSDDTMNFQDNFVKKIFSKLQDDEILIEIVEHPEHFKSDDYTIWVSAFVLNPDTGIVKYVPLIKKDELILLTGKGNDFESINALYTNKNSIEVVFKNILNQFIGKKRIFLVSSGMVNNINIAALSYRNKTFGDYFDIINFMFSKDLLSINKIDSMTLNNALLVGNIDYENKNTIDSISQIFCKEDKNIRNNRAWATLKNANNEIGFISELMSSKKIESKILEKRVTKETITEIFANADKYKTDLVHIATHTFFDTMSLTKRANELNKFNNKYFEEDFSLKISSLVLSPADLKKDTCGTNEDQYLSSYEISKLDFMGTKLVVLSSCHSGFGIRSGTENVYGFTRAFRLAGAEKVVVSLWNLYDYPTSVFMKYFYTFLFRDKKNVREALNLVKQQMRKDNYEPYYWAGFVLYE